MNLCLYFMCCIFFSIFEPEMQPRALFLKNQFDTILIALPLLQFNHRDFRRQIVYLFVFFQFRTYSMKLWTSLLASEVLPLMDLNISQRYQLFQSMKVKIAFMQFLGMFLVQSCLLSVIQPSQWFSDIQTIASTFTYPPSGVLFMTVRAGQSWQIAAAQGLNQGLGSSCRQSLMKKSSQMSQFSQLTLERVEIEAVEIFGANLFEMKSCKLTSQTWFLRSKWQPSMHLFDFSSQNISSSPKNSNYFQPSQDVSYDCACTCEGRSC